MPLVRAVPAGAVYVKVNVVVEDDGTEAGLTAIVPTPSVDGAGQSPEVRAEPIGVPSPVAMSYPLAAAYLFPLVDAPSALFVPAVTSWKSDGADAPS